MTPERWATWCASVEPLVPGPVLDGLIASHRAEVLQWPSAVRTLAADSPWLKGIFEGQFDPRLELVASARVERIVEQSDCGVMSREFFELVKAFGRHLDGAFDPPNVLLAEEDDIRSAYGCGGGHAWWERGNATHQVRWDSSASESPSAGMRSTDTWTARGLAPGCSLVLEVDDFCDGRKFIASGPCPAVLELAPAWSAVLRGASFAEAQQVLAQTRVPWRK